MFVLKSRLVEMERDKLAAEARAGKAESINRAYASVLGDIGQLLLEAGIERKASLVDGVRRLAEMAAAEVEEPITEE